MPDDKGFDWEWLVWRSAFTALGLTAVVLLMATLGDLGLYGHGTLNEVLLNVAIVLLIADVLSMLVLGLAVVMDIRSWDRNAG